MMADIQVDAGLGGARSDEVGVDADSGSSNGGGHGTALMQTLLLN